MVFKHGRLKSSFQQQWFSAFQYEEPLVSPSLIRICTFKCLTKKTIKDEWQMNSVMPFSESVFCYSPYQGSANWPVFVDKVLVATLPHLWVCMWLLSHCNSRDTDGMGQSWKYSLAPYRKVCVLCSIDMHLKKPTNKVNSVHHGLVDTCPNLSFLRELHLRLRYDEKIHCLQVKTDCQSELQKKLMKFIEQ